MKRVFAFARHPLVRAAFLAAALGLAVWAVARDWERVTAAIGGIPWPVTLAAVLASVAYVLVSMQSWRAVLADMGSPMGLRDSADVFLVSQVGKYIPGGVWNVVAGAELAKDKGVRRSRAGGALAMTMLVSVLVGTVFAGIGAVVAPHGLPGWVRLLGLAAPIAAVCLHPRVLSRLLAVSLRLVRRPDVATDFTPRGVALASAWAALAWLLAGGQVWALAVGLGLAATAGTAALAVGGFAAAWLVGLAALFMPAGIGARELVLFPVFAASLDRGEVVALVIASRVLLTVADLLAAAIPLASRRRGGTEPDRLASSA